jgi:small subunit ribosomal protein S20
MPNIKSAIKRVKTSEKARQRNMKTKSTIRTLRKQVIAGGETPAEPTTQKALQAFCSALDKGVKHGIICKNTAIRKKNRAAAFLRKAAAAK